MSTRLLLIGDVHLRDGEQIDDVAEALHSAATAADAGDVDAVLLAGDLFEGRSNPTERLVLAEALRALASKGRIVLIIKGNHDQADELAVFRGYPGVQVFEQPAITSVGGVDVLCVPWPEKAFLAAVGHAGAEGDQAGNAALAALLRAMVATREDPARPFVLLGHLSVLGAITSSAQPLVGKGIEAVLGDLQDLGAAFVALGHVHKPQELAPGVEYIGSLTVHDFGEEEEQKRIGILTVEDDGTASVEWIPVPCRRWVTIEATVDGGGAACERLADSDTYVDDLTDHRLAAERLSGSNLRYRYRCTEDEAHLFDHNAIRRRFAAAHTLKIVPEIERTQRVRAAEVAAARTAEEKLAAWGGATGVEITANHIEKLHQLESEAAR
jgi:Icc-related predicted phosphoesterase